MDPRKKLILKAIVDEYIQNAEPVGSKALAERYNIGFSSATLRSEMAFLEEQGYLEQPHTSAGRVPTSLGYRLYVDDLMHRHRITLEEMETINNALRLKLQEYDRLMEETGRFIARMTRYAAITAPPQPDAVKFQKFELFLADPSSLVIVVVLEGGQVRNKLARLQKPADPADIRRLADALNACFAGQPSVTDTLCEKCALLAGSGAEYLPLAAEFMQEIIKSASTRDSYLSGETQLLNHPEFRDVMKARKTLEYLAEQRQSLMNIPAPPSPDSVRITIGPENVASELRDASVIMASFQMRGGQQGLIGLVGPTRMDYSRLASRLTYIAARLGALLQNDEEETS